MDVIINDQIKKTLKSGDAFGELALLYKSPRSGSLKAIEDCGLWGIDRHAFRTVIEEMIAEEFEENRKFINNISFFC